MRVACYIDGFNFYHALDDLAKPHLKWVDLWALSASLCRPGETLEKSRIFLPTPHGVPMHTRAIDNMSPR
jgi:hypothetical protein